jgi:hypothetical protein
MRGILAANGSVAVLEHPEAGSELVTEVIAGERLELVAERRGWWEVVVPSHGTLLDPRGYPGWVPADSLVAADGWSPNLVVVAGNTAGLPLGALLEEGGEVARLPGGGVAGVGAGALRPVGGRPYAGGAVEIPLSLLGLPYRWGGTDSTVGMDCSGLVYRAMQLLGVSVPRDAGDQYEAAPFKSREGWGTARSGDLVFFGETSVTHVGFYLGDGAYVSEHGVGETTIRGMDEDPYWGFARYDAPRERGTYASSPG